MQQQFLTMMTQIPDDIARLAHEQQLGTPQARYMISKLGRGWRWTLYILPFGFYLGLITFFASLLSINIPFINSIFLLLIIIAYCIIIASALTLRFTNKRCTMYPCDKGLILKQSNTKFRVIRWDEIETIWHSSARLPTSLYAGSHIYAIRCHDGYRLTINVFRSRLNNMDNLNQTIDEQFTRRRLPFQFADYQAGQTLNFGPLSINRDGILAHDKMLPWEQVADITLLKDRRLVIYKMGERPEVWLNLPAFKIPNLSILLALFKRIRSGQSEQEAGFAALAAYGTAATIVQSRRKVDALPDGLAALAEEHSLGERRLDQNLGRSRLTSWAVIIFLLVVEAIVLAATITFGVSLSSWFAEVNDGPIFIVFAELSLFGLILTPAIIISLVHHFQHIHNYTYAFERGMILKRGQQTPVVCRWDDIETVWRLPAFNWYNRRQQQITLQRLYAYTLQLRSGVKYTLTRLNINQEALGKIIKEQVVPLQLPATVAAYQTGQTLTFGEVRVNQQGITVGKRLLAWSQVKSVALQDSRLVIYDITRRKPWCKLKTKRTPNLFLLFALADYARDVTA